MNMNQNVGKNNDGAGAGDVDRARGTVLYCCADLVWATKIKSTADSMGVACRPVRNAEMLAARLTDCSVTGLILDLESDHWEAVLGAMRAAPVTDARPIILAFAPHVEVGKMEKAVAAGTDTVLARGAFSRMLPDLLVRMSRDGRGREGEGGGGIKSQMHD